MTVSDAVFALAVFIVAVACMLIAVMYYLRPNTRFGYARVETVHTRVQVGTEQEPRTTESRERLVKRRQPREHDERLCQ